MVTMGLLASLVWVEIEDSSFRSIIHKSKWSSSFLLFVGTAEESSNDNLVHVYYDDEVK